MSGVNCPRGFSSAPRRWFSKGCSICGATRPNAPVEFRSRAASFVHATAARCANIVPTHRVRAQRWDPAEIDNPDLHETSSIAGLCSPFDVYWEGWLLKKKARDFERVPAAEEHVPPHESVASTSGRSARQPQATSGSSGVPVYVMLPLDTVRIQKHPDGTTFSRIQNELELEIALRTLKEAGVTGVMVDVWWGIVEREAPSQYDFSAYKLLFHKIASAGLKLQAVMSFHAAGSNVGDTCTISIPPWVHAAGDRDPDIYFTDRGGYRNRECLSIGCDHEPVLWGATPLQLYEGVVTAFCTEFSHLFGTVITEITLGCGPAGELRYPAYPEGDRRWRFPGVGEFQCYDKYMLRDLEAWAHASGRPEWGLSGPHDAGGYCSRAHETGFFHPEWGSWRSEYGHFFLEWYSSQLVRHAEDMMALGRRALSAASRPRVMVSSFCTSKAVSEHHFQPPIPLGLKLAGVHWCYRQPCHAAEVTAGYYNVAGRDGYASIFDVVSRHQGTISFTCVEMRDCEHPPESACSPELLLQQMLHNSERYGVELTGENALQRYDHHGLHRIRESAFCERARERGGGISQLTFLRMGNLMFDHWTSFTHLVQELNNSAL